MIIDLKKGRNTPDEVTIKDKVIERVSSYKYSGVVMDNRLAWHDHIDYLVKRINPRLYCMRRLHKFNVDTGGYEDVVVVVSPELSANSCPQILHNIKVSEQEIPN